MNETESLNGMIVLADEMRKTIIYEPEIDPLKDLTPEMQAKLIAMNEHFRRKPTRPESTSNEETEPNG